MTNDAQSYNLRALRNLLVDAFDSKELRNELVWEDPQFGDSQSGHLADEFAPEESRKDRATKIVDWCDRHGRISYLVQRVKELRQEKYEDFEEKLVDPIIPAPPTPVPPPPERGSDPIRILRDRWPWIAVGLALVLIAGFATVWLLFFGPGTPTPEPIDAVTPPTDTYTATPASTATPTGTRTPTGTPMPTSTATPSSTPTPTATATPTHTVTPTPTPTHSPAQIELRDVFAKSDDGTLTLNIVVENTGDESVLIKRARIHMLDYKDFYFAGCVLGRPPAGSGLQPSMTYDLDISDLTPGQTRDLATRQILGSGEFDNFLIILHPYADWVQWRLYKLKLELIWGTPDQSVLSHPIIFISSRSGGSTESADKLYGYGLSDDQILERFAELGEEPYKYSAEEIISRARECYARNLRDVTGIFSEESMVLSTQARKEYQEWQKATADTP